jgi:beta-galactosidase
MIFAAVLLLLGVGLQDCASAASISLDRGWRFQLGNVANEKLSCEAGAVNEWTGSLEGWVCPAWPRKGFGDAWRTEAECALYCCSEPSCIGYLYNGTAPNTCGREDGCTPSCLVGESLDTCYKAQPGAVGFTSGMKRSATPAKIPIPPASGPHEANYNDSRWRQVSAPHDFIIESNPDPGPMGPRHFRQRGVQNDWSHGYRPKNISWYRRHVSVERSVLSKTVWLEFDGVFRASDVWLNGVHLGHHSSGYTGFRYRIDNKGLAAENVIAVRVDARANEGWWYEGGGILRHVRLVYADTTHIVPAGGVFVQSNVTGEVDRSSSPPIADASAVIETQIATFAQGSVSCAVRSTITAPNGSAVWSSTSASVSVSVGASHIVRQTAALPTALLWDAELAPTLYTLLTELIVGTDTLTDSNRATTFGIRRMTFDANKGLILNDRRVKVKGTCNHHDFAGVGAALPDSLNRFRVSTLQEWGVNAWRMSHNPPAPELLDMTDEHGMLVWDEMRHFGDFQLWREEARDTILRDRNHPSIMMYSLCNEWGCSPDGSTSGANGSAALATGLQFRGLVKALDPTRAITSAYDWHDPLIADAWAEEVTDVFGINYNSARYDEVHAKHPTLPIIGSEDCNAKTDRGLEANASEALLGLEGAGSDLIYPKVSKCWSAVANRSFVAGQFTWTGFDYRGEEVPTYWPSTNSHFGFLDLDRAGFPKASAFWWLAQYQPDTPLAHLAIVANESMNTIDAFVYTSGDAVELYIDGALVGSRQSFPEFGRALFPAVKLPAGITPSTVGLNYTAVVYRGRESKAWAVDTVMVAGAAVAIRLSLDWPRAGSDFAADGQAVALIRATVVDAKGTVVRALHKTGHELSFSVADGDATVVGTGNGDPSDDFNATGHIRRAWSGYARAIVKVGTTPGTVRVEASAGGLQTGSAVIQTNPE